MKESIGFVGVGRMGANMAMCLRDAGYAIPVVYDAKPELAAAAAVQAGARAAASLADVTANVDTIVTVVSDDEAMERIFARSGDSLLEGALGKLFVNCATVSPQMHVEIERRANSAGADAIEACMASSITQAREGTLYLMIGGKEEAFTRARPLLEKMSSSLRYIGTAGRAAQVKALVNMVMNINTAGLAEGLGLAHALGLDLTVIREVFAQTGAASRVLETDGEDMQYREHSVYFSAEHAAKDSGIALDLAREAGVVLPLAQATYEQYERMKSSGLGQLDKSGISELTFADRTPR